MRVPFSRAARIRSAVAPAIAAVVVSAVTQIWDCTGAAAQSFTPTTAPSCGCSGGKCLRARGEAPPRYRRRDRGLCAGGAGEQWMLSNDGTIVGVPSRLRLNVDGQATAQRHRVQLRTCTPSRTCTSP